MDLKLESPTNSKVDRDADGARVVRIIESYLSVCNPADEIKAQIHVE
jgi:hypothetical protein